MILAPDQVRRRSTTSHIADGLKPGNMVMFAHGFNVHFDQMQPPDDVDVTMVAPKGPGHLVRRVYTEGGGVPALVAVHQNASEKAQQIALAYAKGIGATRARRARDDVQGGDGDRPLRRAGRSSAAARRRWSRRRSRRCARRATSRSSRTSSACTS